MVRRRPHKPPDYQVFLEPRVHAQRRDLPGHVRQRLWHTIHDLGSDPRPHNSQRLDLSRLESEADVPDGIELWRLRLDRWRVVYAIDEDWKAVVVLAIRRRPPYDYEDLISSPGCRKPVRHWR